MRETFIRMLDFVIKSRQWDESIPRTVTYRADISQDDISRAGFSGGNPQRGLEIDLQGAQLFEKGRQIITEMQKITRNACSRSWRALYRHEKAHS